MADPIEADISDALMRHLGSLTLQPPLPVAWPGIGFTPPSGMYLEAQLMMNSNRNRFVGHRSSTEFRGILQVTIVAKAGVGYQPALRIASAVADHFERSRHIDGTTVRVNIDGRPSIASPVGGTDRTRVPVSISFHSFA